MITKDQAMYVPTIFPVSILGDVRFVGFDNKAAVAFAEQENNWHRCDVAEIEEWALVDAYGFVCNRADVGVLFPWLAVVTDEIAHLFLTAPYVMSQDEDDAAELADEIAYYLAHYEEVACDGY